MNCHFTNNRGWMSEPCGIIRFKGEYHLYYQSNPFNPRWERLCWGHATSNDLVHWEEKETAFMPELEYENLNGCLTGCVIEKDGMIHAFYTASGAAGNVICEAVSEDGYHFTKNPSNPVIQPADISPELRISSPKVIYRDGKYYMLLGAGLHNIGKIELYESFDLTEWKYIGELFSSLQHGPVIETPDIFTLRGRDVLMFSTVRNVPERVHFGLGEFMDGIFSFFNPENPFVCPETGPDFYSPCSFSDDGRRILIGWMYNPKKCSGNSRTGTLTAPRQLEITRDGTVRILPIDELNDYIKAESSFVGYENGILRIHYEGRTIVSRSMREEPDISVVEDVGTVEAFLNDGREVITVFIC